MAATVQSNPFQFCVRKIGYSVGLEYLRRRFCDLVDLYAHNGTVDAPNWDELVTSKDAGWGRDEGAKQHIADFFGELNLIKRHNRKIQVLPGLDTASVVVRGLRASSSGAFAALSVVLALKVLEADGDIFLNALAARFVNQQFIANLEDMLAHKRSKLQQLFPQASATRYITEAIDIRLMEAEGIGRPTNEKFDARALRSKLFPDRTGRSRERDEGAWKDYLRKVPGRRKSWAEDLGFFDPRDGITEAGLSLLNGIDSLGMRIEGGAYAFWPYEHEFNRLKVDTTKADIRFATPWEVLSAVLKSRGFRSFHGYGEELRTSFLRDLAEAFELYRSGTRRGLLLHDFPIYVAEPAVTTLQVGRGNPAYDFPAMLKAEFKRNDRQLDHVRIQGTEGGISFLKPAA
jgi:hypothetical protein